MKDTGAWCMNLEFTRQVWHGKPDLASEPNKGTDHWFSKNGIIVYGKIWTRTWQFNHQRAGKEPEIKRRRAQQLRVSLVLEQTSLYLSVKYWDSVVIFPPQAFNDTSHHVSERFSHRVLQPWSELSYWQCMSPWRIIKYNPSGKIWSNYQQKNSNG